MTITIERLEEIINYLGTKNLLSTTKTKQQEDAYDQALRDLRIEIKVYETKKE